MKLSSQTGIIILAWLSAVGCASTNTAEPAAAPETKAQAPAEAPAPAPTQTKEADAQLIAAVAEGDLGAVTAALDAGAFINVKDESGFTVLVNAMAAGNFEIVDFLIQKGAETGLKKPEARSENRVLGDGLAQDELLLAAAEAGDIKSVTRLVEAGANVNARSEDGFTVLVHAISGYHREVIQYLVGKGATIHQ